MDEFVANGIHIWIAQIYVFKHSLINQLVFNACMHMYVLYRVSGCTKIRIARIISFGGLFYIFLCLVLRFNIHFICLHNVPILFSITSPFLAHTFKTNSRNLFCTLVYMCAYERVCVAVSYILEKSLHLILMASK